MKHKVFPKLMALLVALCFVTTLSGFIASGQAHAMPADFAVIPGNGGGNPSGNGNGNGNGGQQGGKTKDPAANPNIACTANKCPLIKKYVNPLIALLSGLVGVVTVMAIIIGGIEFSTAGGDPQKSANGKKHIRNALIGLVAFIFFYAFLKFILIGDIN